MPDSISAAPFLPAVPKALYNAADGADVLVRMVLDSHAPVNQFICVGTTPTDTPPVLVSDLGDRADMGFLVDLDDLQFSFDDVSLQYSVQTTLRNLYVDGATPGYVGWICALNMSYGSSPTGGMTLLAVCGPFIIHSHN